ncbi:Bax inhibitor-1/YccA family protein [uncultured Modestobacter sp.]|uniref:Bax inhibitor-1/YccA family protein n=1 Tax=uncultured Modestobacter sp. TaxID=380048 RepID=UPI0026218688|nr:Bax inhibitor-1/YccA family protein [uncultured Modestobacter sp.]
MPSSNPAFSRGFPAAGTGQNAGWGTAPQQTYGGAPTQQDPYAAPSPYAATGRAYLTMDDVVTKTGITFLVTVLAAAATWALPGTSAAAFALPAVLIAFVIAMVISFKQIANPGATLAFAALEGIALGAISELYALQFGGNIIMQAVIGTFGVFVGMLVVYKTGAIRVTPKLTRWIVGAMFGVLALVLVNLVASFFTPGGLGLRDGGTFAIIFSLVVIGVAAFSLLLDFDMADEAIRRGAEPKFAWYIAFGLLVTVVWLYLEILRLLSYLQSSD